MSAHSAAVLTAVMLLVGCAAPPTPFEPADQSALQQHRVQFRASENEHLMAFVVDLSQSFAERFNDEEGAFTWMLKVIESYGREFPGSEGRIVIAQISGNPDTSPLVWEGRPSHLRRTFTNAAEFREFLLSRSLNAPGTPLYESLGDTFEFLLRHPTVRSGQSGVDVVVVSDMVDNADHAGAEKQRVSELLQQFADRGSYIGFYYIDNSVTGDIEELMHESGYPGYYFTTMIDRYPEIPEFNPR